MTRRIEGFPHYLISEDGSVFNTRYKRYLKPHLNSSGYLIVTLSDAGTKRRDYIHRLVAQAYIHNPNCLPQVNHIDEDKRNNHVSNLEWCTNQYNNEYTRARYYLLVAPSGEVVTVYNLKKFCRDNDLNAGHMCKVMSGKLNQHKGWTKYDSGL